MPEQLSEGYGTFKMQKQFSIDPENKALGNHAVYLHQLKPLPQRPDTQLFGWIVCPLLCDFWVKNGGRVTICSDFPGKVLASDSFSSIMSKSSKRRKEIVRSVVVKTVLSVIFRYISLSI